MDREEKQDTDLMPLWQWERIVYGNCFFKLGPDGAVRHVPISEVLALPEDK